MTGGMKAIGSRMAMMPPGESPASPDTRLCGQAFYGQWIMLSVRNSSDENSRIVAEQHLFLVDSVGDTGQYLMRSSQLEKVNVNVHDSNLVLRLAHGLPT
jgi:hypothetical protein